MFGNEVLPKAPVLFRRRIFAAADNDNDASLLDGTVQGGVMNIDPIPLASPFLADDDADDDADADTDALLDSLLGRSVQVETRDINPVQLTPPFVAANAVEDCYDFGFRFRFRCGFLCRSPW